MKTKLIRMGKSLGVRIPEPFLEELGLTDEVELRVVGSQILIEAPVQSGRGWSQAAALLRKRGEHGLLDISSE